MVIKNSTTEYSTQNGPDVPRMDIGGSTTKEDTQGVAYSQESNGDQATMYNIIASIGSIKELKSPMLRITLISKCLPPLVVVIEADILR